MSRAGTGLPAVAAFTLVVPMLATPAAAAPAPAPMLPVQPRMALDPPPAQDPWLAAGVTFAPSADEPDYDLYGFEREDADTLTLTADPVVARSSDTGEPLSSGQPAFSPDGSQVVFSTQLPETDTDPATEPGWVLMRGDVAPAGDGTPGVSGLTRLDYPTEPGAADYRPAWSPDGRYIAFVRELPGTGSDTDPGPRTYILDLDHRDLDNPDAALTEVVLPEDPAGPGNNYRWVSEPSWSPDGSGLIVVGSIGASTGTLFAPVDPEIAGTGSLWYYDLAGGTVHHLMVGDGCGGDPCSPVEARTVAWSPDSNVVAFTPWWGSGIEQLTLPDTPLPDGTDDLVLAEGGEPMIDGELPQLQDLAWEPDGSALYASMAQSPEVVRIAAGESTTVYQDFDSFPELLGLAVQPWSDLGITLDVPGNPVTGTTITATAEVTNAGPSPSRPGQAQIEVPAAATVGALPGGCTAPVDQVITCELDPLAVDEAETFALDLTLNTPSDTAVSATVASASPDPNTAGATGNLATATVVAYAPPDGRSRQISFTLNRLHQVEDEQRYSEDLVQSLLPGPGDDATSIYRVLADEEYDRLIQPDGDEVEGRFLVDEDSIDYSPDGSRVVYTRWSQQNEDFGDNEYSDRFELVVADVVGTQSEDGEPGAFINTRVIDTGPDAGDGYTAYHPVWSPDGTRIAFLRDERGTPGTELLVYDVSDPDAAPVDPVAGDDGPYLLDLTWSPDGTGLIFSMSGDSASSLWHLPLTSAPAPPQLLLGPDGEPLVGHSAVWSPDGTMLAFTSSAELEREALYLAELPETIGAGQVQTTAVARAEQFDDLGADGALLVRDPTWSPDGAQLAVATQDLSVENGPYAVMAMDLPSGEVSDLPDAPVSSMFIAALGEETANPEYEPYSDVRVAVETGSPAQTGAGTDVTVTVTNSGPSPARDAILTLTLPGGVSTGAPPEGCTADADTLTCELPGPIAPGAELPLTLPVTATEDGSYAFTATVVTNSVDPEPGNDDATATLVAATGDSERIAFSMERTGDPAVEAVQDESLDLVRSLTTEPGDPAATDYTVLADAVYDQVTSPDGGQSPFAYFPDENHLDFTADGSRVVFERVTRTQEWSAGEFAVVGTDTRLVVADVVGGLEEERGEPGDLVDVTEMPTDETVEADGYSDSQAVWSPDGDRLAFVRTDRDGDSYFGDRVLVLEIGSAGLDPAAVASPFDPDWLAANVGPNDRMSSPTWSPDGDALIFAWHQSGQDAPTLHYLPLSTGIPHPLALPDDGSVCWPGFGGDWCAGPVQGFEPAWSPGGDQVAFSYWASGGLGIAVLTLAADTAEQAADAAPGDELPIAGLDGVEALLPDGPNAPPVDAPTWSPDGQQLAAAVGNSDFVDEIAAVTLATGERSTMFRAEDVPTDLAHPEFETWSDVAVTIDPAAATITTQAPAPVTVTVTNHGPSPARDGVVTITLPSGGQVGTPPSECTADGRTLTCELPGPIAAGAELPLTLPVTFTATGEHEITATVATNSIDPEPGNDHAARTFTVTTPPEEPTDEPTEPTDEPTGPPGTAADLRVQLTLDADRAWLGGDGLPAQLRVTNQGTAPAAGVQLSTALPTGVLILDAGPCPLTGPCDLDTLASGDQVDVDLVLQPTAVGQVELTASATTTTRDPRPGNNTDSAAFEAVQAQLRLLPSVAEPGEATLLYGLDLPPDAEITVRWSEGLTSNHRPIAANADGTLRAPLLIIDGDRLGRRDLQVASVAGTAFGLETPPTMLVVPQSVAPPNFLGRS